MFILVKPSHKFNQVKTQFLWVLFSHNPNTNSVFQVCLFVNKDFHIMFYTLVTFMTKTWQSFIGFITTQVWTQSWTPSAYGVNRCRHRDNMQTWTVPSGMEPRIFLLWGNTATSLATVLPKYVLMKHWPQCQSNTQKRIVAKYMQCEQCIPLLRSLHWLPAAPQIQFKTLMLAYKAKVGTVPMYFQSLIKPCTVPHNLRVSSLASLHPPPRTQGRQASRLFSVLTSKGWNEFPLSVRTSESHSVFKKRPLY